MKTYAPSSTKSLAVANPIPSVPPVMTAILPPSLFVIVFLWLHSEKRASWRDWFLCFATRGAYRFARSRRRASNARSRRRLTPARSLRRTRPHSPRCSFCASRDLPSGSDRPILADEPTLLLAPPWHQSRDPRRPSWAATSRSVGSCLLALERPSRDGCQTFAPY